MTTLPPPGRQAPFVKRIDVRAVTYDCWGTLITDRDWEAAMSMRAEALSSILGMDERDARALLHEAWQKHDEAWKRLETFGPGRMAAYCLEARGVIDDAASARLAAAFEEATTQTGVTAVAGARESLEALAAAGIRRALICDTGVNPGRVVRRLLQRTGLLGFLEVLCFSDEVGVPKPARPMFAKALDELGVDASEAIHVGDLKRTDVAGARAMGMAAARFRGVHDDGSDAPDADVVMDEHGELLEILGLSGAARRLATRGRRT